MAQDKIIKSVLAASDIDCLINFEYKLSVKEQKKIRETLINISQNALDAKHIYSSLVSINSNIKVNKTILEKNCIVNRLYMDKNLLKQIFDNNKSESNVVLQSSLSSIQKDLLVTLLQLRTLFVLKYAYFDEKKIIFNNQWEKIVKELIVSDSVIDKTYAIKYVLNALEDNHVAYKSNRNKRDIPPIVKGKTIEVFPFHFKVLDNNLFIRKIKDPQAKLVNDDSQIKDGMKVLEINGIDSKIWIDSIERTDGPFFRDRNSMLSNILFLYHFYEGKTSFKLYDTVDNSYKYISILRESISMEDYYQIFNAKVDNSVIAQIQMQRPNFHYIKYYDVSKKYLTSLLKSAQAKDTIVLDFRGYPKEQLFSATQLLWGIEEKKVAYALNQNPKTGCFDVKEELTYFTKENIEDRRKIASKNYVVYGIIDNQTQSYPETAAMTCKTYIANFILIGQPTGGALGTIELEKLGDNGEVSYPYHKFMFYNKNQMNAKYQTIPDIFLNNEAINRFIEYGQLGKN